MSRGLPGSAAFANGQPQGRPIASVSIPLARTHAAGGGLLPYLQSTNIEYFERLYRVLTPTGMYAATPQRPVTATMGAFRVPKSQVLIVLDYSFNIYQPSGAAPGDFVPIEPNRLATQVMWDIKVDEKRERQNINYQIIPQRQTQNQQTYAPSNVLAPAQSFEFEIARAAQLQGPGGTSLAGMPQRTHREGLVKVANQYVCRANTTLNVTVSVINNIPIPIAFFEADVFGVLMAQNEYDEYQAANMPTGTAQVPVIVPQSQEP